MAIQIHTQESIRSGNHPHFTGVKNNDISGTADYGNTTASWNVSNTDKLGHSSGDDPAKGIVKWNSQSRYGGWMNTKIGTNSGRWLTGDFIKGCSFQWRTYPNEDGGIALRRFGVEILTSSTNHKRWSSEEINQWSTSSTWKTYTFNFTSDVQSQLDKGWRLSQLHFMVHTPDNGRNTPSKNCILEVKNFKFIYKCPYNTIIPAMRPFSSRDLYQIA